MAIAMKNVEGITIPVNGEAKEVKKISIGSVVLWEKVIPVGSYIIKDGSWQSGFSAVSEGTGYSASSTPTINTGSDNSIYGAYGSSGVDEIWFYTKINAELPIKDSQTFQIEFKSRSYANYSSRIAWVKLLTYNGSSTYKEIDKTSSPSGYFELSGNVVLTGAQLKAGIRVHLKNTGAFYNVGIVNILRIS